MKQVQRGFTLIELVMVIVILGVLAAVAIPKFVDLKSDARGRLGWRGWCAQFSCGNQLRFTQCQYCKR
ncbi:MAG: prepilin-type N-terminal cleavage/methylation domain-containing protein [Rhodoferax sp.]|nr:prepilin-type N-terminal cleavage/methylation domain-containing protein [Rhodoferax sp.]